LLKKAHLLPGETSIIKKKDRRPARDATPPRENRRERWTGRLPLRYAEGGKKGLPHAEKKKVVGRRHRKKEKGETGESPADESKERVSRALEKGGRNSFELILRKRGEGR